MLDSANRHGPVTLKPRVRLKGAGTFAGDANANAQLARETPAPEHDIGRKRLDQTGRRRTSSGYGRDCPTDWADYDRVGSIPGGW
jgi:hypothetical protein